MIAMYRSQTHVMVESAGGSQSDNPQSHADEAQRHVIAVELLPVLKQQMPA